ncbi:DUF6082 family protein [Streptomyces tubercidicus]|uniref:DUF6082 family protein n=1 Tax=Streptomyces tubercidicus TaxID=47759 RepID=UPI003793EF63
MKLTTAVLLAGAAVAGVGAARLVQEKRHQQARSEIALAQNQINWLTQVATNYDLAKLWKPATVKNVEEYMQMMHANQQLCIFGLRDRLGFVSQEKLHFYADWVMNREVCQKYWKTFGTLRADAAAGDKRAERFTEALDSAARAHEQKSSAAAAAGSSPVR